MAPALTTTDLPKLKLVARGKVRDIYALPDIQDADKLLFVATDRISAFDVVMENVSRSGTDSLREGNMEREPTVGLK